MHTVASAAENCPSGHGSHCSAAASKYSPPTHELALLGAIVKGPEKPNAVSRRPQSTMTRKLAPEASLTECSATVQSNLRREGGEKKGRFGN